MSSSSSPSSAIFMPFIVHSCPRHVIHLSLTTMYGKDVQQHLYRPQLANVYSTKMYGHDTIESSKRCHVVIVLWRCTLDLKMDAMYLTDRRMKMYSKDRRYVIKINVINVKSPVQKMQKMQKCGVKNKRRQNEREKSARARRISRARQHDARPRRRSDSFIKIHQTPSFIR